jgi:hypothetical protein
MARKEYKTTPHLTAAQWAFVEPIIPPQEGPGRHPHAHQAYFGLPANASNRCAVLGTFLRLFMRAIRWMTCPIADITFIN